MFAKRLMYFIVILIFTVATSWYVARQVSGSGADATSINPVAPVSVLDREVISLNEETIAPVISANAMVVPNSDGEGWLLEAAAPSDAVAYQLLDEPVGVKALINGGPTGFDCEWAGLGYAGGPSDSGLSKASIGLPTDATNVTMQCAIPEDIRASHGMNGMMVIQLTRPKTVPALPVTAVAGSAGQGQVVIVHGDGTTESRTVELGVSDTYNIEITSGLEAEDQVLLYPVQEDFAAALQP